MTEKLVKQQERQREVIQYFIVKPINDHMILKSAVERPPIFPPHDGDEDDNNGSGDEGGRLPGRPPGKPPRDDDEDKDD
jgi:hypothetical protein